MNKLIITEDKQRFNIAMIYDFLRNESYWAKNIMLHVAKQVIFDQI